MAKGYEDLSRRALIKLGKDYDQENDAALLQYLTEHSNDYENIRFMEKVMVKTDNIAEKLKGASGVIKTVLANESTKVIESVIDAVIMASSEAEKGLNGLKENIQS